MARAQTTPRVAEQGAPQPYLISAEAYHRMGEAGVFKPHERVELLDGRIYEMTPIGSRHADFVDRLNELFVKAAPLGVKVRIQNPILLAPKSEPEPDLALLLPREQPYAERHPGAQDVALVVEVADSSLEYDRQTKLPLYAAAGVPETWLFDLQNDRAEVFRRPSADGYRLSLRPETDETLSCERLPEFRLDLTQVF